MSSGVESTFDKEDLTRMDDKPTDDYRLVVRKGLITLQRLHHESGYIEGNYFHNMIWKDQTTIIEED